MLVLERKPQERIICDLGDGRLIVIEVLRDSTNALIKLGIDAPKDVLIDREEVWWKRRGNDQRFV